MLFLYLLATILLSVNYCLDTCDAELLHRYDMGAGDHVPEANHMCGLARDNCCSYMD